MTGVLGLLGPEILLARELLGEEAVLSAASLDIADPLDARSTPLLRRCMFAAGFLGVVCDEVGFVGYGTSLWSWMLDMLRCWFEGCCMLV